MTGARGSSEESRPAWRRAPGGRGTAKRAALVSENSSRTPHRRSVRRRPARGRRSPGRARSSPPNAAPTPRTACARRAHRPRSDRTVHHRRGGPADRPGPCCAQRPQEGRDDGRDLRDETVELLQHLIRNQCVNDGTPDSGDEIRNADLLQTLPRGRPASTSSASSAGPGRTSSSPASRAPIPTAPTLCLMGHTDVVPVNAAGWTRDPVRRRARRRRGVGPRRHRHAEPHGLDGGRVPAPRQRRLPAEGHAHLLRRRRRGGRRRTGARSGWSTTTGTTPSAATTCSPRSAAGRRSAATAPAASPSTSREKGIAWRRLRVRGTPGHGSMPFGADNALVKAAEVVRRLADVPPGVADRRRCGRRRSTAMRTARRPEAGLLDPAAHLGDARRAAAAARAPRATPARTRRFSPNVVHGGQKTNIDPRHHRHRRRHPHGPRRRPPTTSTATFARRSATCRRTSRSRSLQQYDATRVGRPTTPLWDALRRACRSAFPGAELLPGAHRRRHRRPLLPREGRGRLRRRPVLPGGHARGVRPAASTATTSASTSSRWASPPISGSAWRAICSAERGSASSKLECCETNPTHRSLMSTLTLTGGGTNSPARRSCRRSSSCNAL